MKHYRYRKITPEILKKMKKLREGGLSYQKIGEKINVSKNVAIYHLNPEEKEKAIKRSHKSLNKMTKKQKLERSRKAYPRMKKYIKERYNNDPEFRKRFLNNVLRSQKRIRGQRRERGLCTVCGKGRQNKNFILCGKCREKERKYKKEKSK